MAQSEIYELLKNKRLSGDDSFFTAEQIRKMLKDKGVIIASPSLLFSLRRLRNFGFLEYNITSKKIDLRYNKYVYRLKKEYL